MSKLITFLFIGILICTSADIAKADTRTESDLLRDVLLTIPPIGKSAVFLSSMILGLSDGPGSADEYPVPFNIIAYTLVGGISATNIGMVISGWFDLPNRTRMWRRAVFGFDAAGALFGLAMLIADIIQPAPSGSAVVPILTAIASFSGLMVLDLFPFSTEKHAGMGYGL